MNIERATFVQVAEMLQHKERCLAYVPIGCTEQHGPLLPMGTDSLVAQAMAEALCQRLESGAGWAGAVYPVVSYTPSRSNVDYAGSTSVSEAAFRGYVSDLCRSILHHDYDALVLVCMHGPAEPSLIELAFQLNSEQAAQSGRLRPVIVLGVTRFAAVFQRVLGSAAGKHADFKEFLLVYQVLGEAVGAADQIARLKAFGRRYRTAPPKAISLPGLPMQLRSVDGVIGLPWPEDENIAYEPLAVQLWHELLAAFAASVTQAFQELELL